MQSQVFKVVTGIDHYEEVIRPDRPAESVSQFRPAHAAAQGQD